MPRPELILRQPKPRARLSIILLDWGVRESFHTLHYLAQQSLPRDEVEILWLEFYRRRPAELEQMVFRAGSAAPLVDTWLTAGYDDDLIFNKHRLYNLGILLAQSPICVICDSDAIYTPNFCARLLQEFERTPRSVVHLDEIRNEDPRFHPFAYPTMEEILGPGCINWHVDVSRGLNNSSDMLHQANYGACMAAPRDAMLAVGGADEHLDYLGYICGPYDLTFRLAHHGLPERWLRDEYLYHVWHPNQSGINNDYQGPHDGAYMSLRALEARALGRIEPCVENPWIRAARHGQPLDVPQLLQQLEACEEPSWRVGCQPPTSASVFYMQKDYKGFDIFVHERQWYALPCAEGPFDPDRSRRYRLLLSGKDMPYLHQLIDYYTSLPTTFWGRVKAQPLYRLPARAARRVGREIARILR